ncbi:MAG: dUTPase [Candidatus Aureabacteria bacterium]|nr:dUTPase [Candidatus Auribacterota bacterium]
MEDKLQAMFEMQKKLNKRIGVDTDDMDAEEKKKWMLNYCRAMSQEIAELVDSVPWKWWAKYQTFDEQNIRVEIIDIFHFLISAAQVIGLTAEDVHRIYMQKNKVNFDRQESGYTEKVEDNKTIQ